MEDTVMRYHVQRSVSLGEGERHADRKDHNPQGRRAIQIPDSYIGEPAVEARK